MRQNPSRLPEERTPDCCATRYPLLMVHGAGFRDRRHWNYWGRIPRELQARGTRVYYGWQDAWGRLEDNARVVAKAVDAALAETGADKVNVIAHSKGGLEARYLVSCLGYAGVFGSDKRWKAICGMALAVAIRCFGHVISGVIFYSQNAWDGWGAWGYSLAYNLSSRLPEGILSILIVSLLPLAFMRRSMMKEGGAA